jgi:hypothetical protein
MTWVVTNQGNRLVLTPPRGSTLPRFTIRMPNSQRASTTLAQIDNGPRGRNYYFLTGNQDALLARAFTSMWNNSAQFRDYLKKLGERTALTGLNTGVEINLMIALPDDSLSNGEYRRFFNRNKLRFGDNSKSSWMGTASWFGQKSNSAMIDGIGPDGTLRFDLSAITLQMAVVERAYIAKGQVISDDALFDIAAREVLFHETGHLVHGTHPESYVINRSNPLAVAEFLRRNDKVYKDEFQYGFANNIPVPSAFDADGFPKAFVFPWEVTEDQYKIYASISAAISKIKAGHRAPLLSGSQSSGEFGTAKDERLATYVQLKKALDDNTAVENKMKFLGGLGRALGGAIANSIATDDEWQRIGVNTVLGAIGLNLGEYIGASQALRSAVEVVREAGSAADRALGCARRPRSRQAIWSAGLGRWPRALPIG